VHVVTDHLLVILVNLYLLYGRSLRPNLVDLLVLTLYRLRPNNGADSISHRCVGTGVSRGSSGAHFYGELI